MSLYDFFHDAGKYEKQIYEDRVFVDYHDLYDFDCEHESKHAMSLLDNPEKILEELRVESGKPVEVVNLVITSKLRSLGTEHLGKLVQIEGIITSASIPDSRILEASFLCTVCDKYTMIKQEISKLVKPEKCQNYDCDNRKFRDETLDLTKSKYVDFQLLSLQEDQDELPSGEIPEPIEIHLYGDLVRSVSAGHHVKIVGVVKLRERKANGVDYIRFLETVSIISHNDNPEDIDLTEEEVDEIVQISKTENLEELMILSYAPSIFGWEHVKQALLYSQFGGVRRERGNLYTRGDVNVLLAGDPGTAKTQMLYYTQKLSVRGVMSTAGGASAVGLTAALTKVDERYIVNAGTLALADKGIACVAENQRVMTEYGLKKIQDVSIGDAVLSSNGEFINVSNKFFNGYKNTVNVGLYSGDIIECTTDHKILTQRGWVEAQELCDKDYVKLPIVASTDIEQNEFELGFIHGFGLSDISFNEKSNKNRLGFSASIKNNDRTEHVRDLLRKHYDANIHVVNNESITTMMRGKPVKWSPTTQTAFSSKQLKNELIELFHNQKLYSNSYSYKIGLISGILSTDGCVSHKQGTYGIKHEIDITLGRIKYNDNCMPYVMKLVSSILHQLGVMSVIRGRKIIISSLRSYNRVVQLFSDKLVGKNKKKLYHVTPKSKVTSYDSVLDDEYGDWFCGIKWRQSYAVKHGLSSRIWNATKNRRVTIELMETFKPHWSNLTDEPYKEPEKPYLLNPVRSIESGENMRVYDLTIPKTHAFTICGGVVHNCIDEVDKMNDVDRAKIHQAMEQQIIKVDKGGLHLTLNARCAVVAACNPTGSRYNTDKTLPDNVKDLPDSFLTRFDLAFIMIDHADEDFDEGMADLILGLGESEVSKAIPFDLLKKYIIYAKRIIPTATLEARQRIKEYYIEKRQQKKDDDGLKITPRQLEGIPRMAEARARMHLREEITIEDIEVVLKLLDISVNEVYTDPSTGKIDYGIANDVPSSKRKQAERMNLVVELIMEESGNSDFVRMKELERWLVRNWGVDTLRARDVIKMAIKMDIIMSPFIDRVML